MKTDSLGTVMVAGQDPEGVWLWVTAVGRIAGVSVADSVKSGTEHGVSRDHWPLGWGH